MTRFLRIINIFICISIISVVVVKKRNNITVPAFLNILWLGTYVSYNTTAVNRVIQVEPRFGRWLGTMQIYANSRLLSTLSMDDQCVLTTI